nr:uncharacterized protein LOC120968563 [Aegilops tauschii subsp. strangulata]
MGRRFKSESFWPKAEGFMETVSLAWHSVPSSGNPFVVLESKLRATAKRLQSWSDRWIGNVKLQISIAMELILRLDMASDPRPLSRAEFDLRKRRNLITTINKDGLLLTGQESIAAAVDEYYEGIFGTAPEREFAINLQALNLPRRDLLHLERPFTEEEVERVIKSMPLDKAPGPDGFTGRFYASCWQIIKVDFMRALEAFSIGDMHGLGCINKALVALFPKVDGAEELRDFRPVSLVHGAVKIFDKAMAVRLAEELPFLTNMRKSAVIPIRCSQQQIQEVGDMLGCSVGGFPCKYLGLPLSLRKQSASQMQYLVDRIGACLPTWWASSLPKSGRLLLVLLVLSAMPIHAMMAMELPAKTVHAINKIIRAFLWCGKKEARGGNCSVAWTTVCTPKWAGGLGVPDLRWMNVAMQARWPWLKRSGGDRCWHEFKFSVPKESMQLYLAATRMQLGDGCGTLFWEGRWLDGFRVQELAPAVCDAVSPRLRRTQMVADALESNGWARDIGPDLQIETIREYLRLWTRVSGVELQEGIPDVALWSWERGGVFSVRSAYAAKFAGRMVAPTADFSWKSRAPLQCQMFSWLALRNRCWTSDRLARRGLPHQDSYPFCNQEEDTINHILLTCVLSREVWTHICHALEEPTWAPGGEEVLSTWCQDRAKHDLCIKTSRAIILLGLWQLWKHRNTVVFDNAAPSVAMVMRQVEQEGRAWWSAGLMKGDVDGLFGRLSTWSLSE